jgi:hypothetical protein
MDCPFPSHFQQSVWFYEHKYLWRMPASGMWRRVDPVFQRNVSSHKIYRVPHPEDGILHSHCCENLKSYIEMFRSFTVILTVNRLTILFHGTSFLEQMIYDIPCCYQTVSSNHKMPTSEHNYAIIHLICTFKTDFFKFHFNIILSPTSMSWAVFNQNVHTPFLLILSV